VTNLKRALRARVDGWETKVGDLVGPAEGEDSGDPGVGYGEGDKEATREPKPSETERSHTMTTGDTNVETRDTVNVRYMVDDVDAAVDFYTNHFGFTVRTNFAPAFADVVRGSLRLLLSGPTSSAGRPMPDGRKPEPGGWNRIHFIVDDIETEVERLREAGLPFRNDIVSGPGGKQILVDDPAGNPIEIFQPADS
jgi:catechol 2,3-dioxygenase-like lactoylglutathione lyase family enzyme